jgi:hypothetical protein
MRAMFFVLMILTAGVARSASGDVTFSRDVLPILQRRCQLCHRPGEAGRGSFLTYETTRP